MEDQLSVGQHLMPYWRRCVIAVQVLDLQLWEENPIHEVDPASVDFVSHKDNVEVTRKFWSFIIQIMNFVKHPFNLQKRTPHLRVVAIYHQTYRGQICPLRVTPYRKKEPSSSPRSFLPRLRVSAQHMIVI